MSFEESNFTEGLNNLTKQAQYLFVFGSLQNKAKLAVQCLERDRPHFQQAQNMRARRRQQMGFPGVFNVNNALIIPASFEKPGRRAQAKDLQSAARRYARQSRYSLV